MTVFYLHFSSCHSDLGKSCSCWDLWWFLIYFNSPAYRLLLSRRSCGLLSIVFIIIYDPLKSREKLTRIICSSMQGKDRPSSANTLKRGLGEPVWIMSKPCSPALVSWQALAVTRVFLGSTSEGAGSFVRGYIHFSLRPLVDVEQEEMPRLEHGKKSFWLWPAVISHPVTFLHLQLI